MVVTKLLGSKQEKPMAVIETLWWVKHVSELNRLLVKGINADGDFVTHIFTDGI